jgi:dissimilatory sulfite reductase related protein
VIGVSSAPSSTAGPGRNVRTILGLDIAFDEQGFLWDPLQWTQELAEVLAKESGMEKVSDRHWMILRFLREYYLQNGRAPLNRQIKQGTGISLLEMEALFPGGIKYGARRFAGLPNPRSCS